MAQQYQVLNSEAVAEAQPETAVQEDVDRTHELPPKHDSEAVHTSSTTSQGDTHNRPARLQRILLDSWIPEVIAVSLSTLCLIAIVITLLRFDGRAPPHPRYGITLNAVIATLATASRSTLLYSTGAAIGQLKWCWYLQSHRLRDLQIFDDASRGPWGSVSLMYSLRLRPLASIGAVITILALAVDPFVQLILTYPVRPALSPTAPDDLLRAPNFQEIVRSDSGNFTNAVNAGVYSEPQNFYQQPHCPTGNCTWPAFRSVGWCSKCQDAKSKVQIAKCNIEELYKDPGSPDWAGVNGCQAHFGYGNGYPLFQGIGNHTIPGWPPNITVSAANAVADAVWVLHSDDWSYGEQISANNTLWPNESSATNTYLGVFNPVLALARLSVTWALNQQSGLLELPKVDVAEECVLTLCSIEYKISTVNGVINTEILDTDYGFIKKYSMDELNKNTWIACWQSTNRSELARANQTIANPSLYSDNEFFCPLSLASTEMPYVYGRAIADRIGGVGTLVFYDPAVTNADDAVYIQNDDPVYSNAVVRYIATSSLNKVVIGVAASLSSLSITSASEFLDQEQVSGTAWVSETHVAIAWYWLVLPFALNISGVAFLLLAIVQSRRTKMKPWKASILPLLYHGLESHTLSEMRGSEDVSAMEEMANRTEVRFERPHGKMKSRLKES